MRNEYQLPHSMYMKNTQYLNDKKNPTLITRASQSNQFEHVAVFLKPLQNCPLGRPWPIVFVLCPRL